LSPLLAEREAIIGVVLAAVEAWRGRDDRRNWSTGLRMGSGLRSDFMAALGYFRTVILKRQ